MPPSLSSSPNEGKTTMMTGENKLTVIDHRTGLSYKLALEDTVPNCIRATQFRAIKGFPSERDEKEDDEDDSGLLIFDPSYMNTACVNSRISYIDGDRGILQYRGYSIEDLAEQSNFLEVAYLLIYGDLPNSYQYADWSREIMTHTFLHVKVTDLMQSFHYDAHPMGMFISSMAAMSAFHPEANPSLKGADIYQKNSKLINKQIKRIMGKVTTIAANAYRHRIGRPYNYPQNHLGYTENFLYMLDYLSEKDYKPNPVLVKALDVLFILHAEHEMNCSTAAMRHIASSQVDPYCAVAGAASALFGPLHGGANEAVLRMLENDIKTIEGIDPFLALVKDKKKKLMGFGHRIYKKYDPRAKIIQKLAYDVFSVCGEEPLIHVAKALQEKALADPYFKTRHLYPNVDFYSGLIYKAMGFPTDFFPVLFAIPRTVGWLAHWREGLESGLDVMKIWRPRQIYTGSRDKTFVAIDDRPAGSMDEIHKTNSDHHPFYKRSMVADFRGKREGSFGE